MGASMPRTATLQNPLRDAIVVQEEVLMVRAERNSSRSAGCEGKGLKSLYVTSGAMFTGLLGVFLFAAPGGVIGAAFGAFVGLLYAQHRPAA
jgi:uncharacterized membrane protein